MEIYRCRWQVELAFKRLKSILGLGNLKKFDPEAARAWLHGKLLVAALIQALISAGSTFSPWGFPIGNGTVLRSFHLEGNPPYDEILSSSNHSLDRDEVVHTKLEEHITKTQGGVQEAQIANGKTHGILLIKWYKLTPMPQRGAAKSPTADCNVQTCMCTPLCAWLSVK